MKKQSVQLLSLFLVMALMAFTGIACKKTPKQLWETSGHADAASEAFRHWDEDGEVPTSCAACHTTDGFIDFVADGTVDAAVPAADSQGITCDACHDANAEALTTITFPSGETVTPTDATTATCGQCHQGRESGASQLAKIAAAGLDGSEDKDTVTCYPANDNASAGDLCTPITFRNVHYAAAAATIFGGLSKVGVEYDGVTYPGKTTHPVSDCTGCHNQHSSAIDVGRNGANCLPCHQFTKDQEFGTLPGQATVANALALLLAGIQEYAENHPDADCITYDGASYPYWFADDDCDGGADSSYTTWTPRLVKAAYNYQVGLKDAGAWAHNKPYILAILASSLADLGLSGYLNP